MEGFNFKQGDCWVWNDPQKVEYGVPPDLIKVASFNIERGYNAEKQADFLLDKKVDIALLQEVDIMCKRTGSRNIVELIARRAKFRFAVWGNEFEEIDSPKRSEKLAGGGYHGNAILSNYPIFNSGSICHTLVERSILYFHVFYFFNFRFIIGKDIHLNLVKVEELQFLPMY